MSTSSLQSVVNKARGQFENGYVKACLDTLKYIISDLIIVEGHRYRLKNETSVLLAKLNTLKKLQGQVSEQSYMVESNRLLEHVMDLILDFEVAAEESATATIDNLSPFTYSSQLTLDLNYEKTPLTDLHNRITDIERLLQTKLDLLKRIEEITSGSVIIKLNLYAQEIIKIKSLLVLRLIDSALSFTVLDPAWDWINKKNFVLQLEGVDLQQKNLMGANLIEANLSKANLNEANLRAADMKGVNLRRTHMKGAYLVGADLFGADLFSADLSRANLRGVYLKKADLVNVYMQNATLIKANLSGSDLSRANLIGADLTEANLSKAILERANLNGANLSGANLRRAIINEVTLIDANLKGAIFHIDQATTLTQMGVDISVIVFVDDEGRKVTNGVVIE